MRFVGGPRDGQEGPEPSEVERLLVVAFHPEEVRFFADKEGGYLLSYGYVSEYPDDVSKAISIEVWEEIYKWSEYGD